MRKNEGGREGGREGGKARRYLEEGPDDEGADGGEAVHGFGEEGVHGGTGHRL